MNTDPAAGGSEPIEELPMTIEEVIEADRKAAARKRPERRIINRSGITKNKGQKADKQKRKQQKESRRKNR